MAKAVKLSDTTEKVSNNIKPPVYAIIRLREESFMYLKLKEDFFSKHIDFF